MRTGLIEQLGKCRFAAWILGSIFKQQIDICLFAALLEVDAGIEKGVGHIGNDIPKKRQQRARKS